MGYNLTTYIPGYELVADYTVGSVAGSVILSGLNIGKGETYMLVADVFNAYTGGQNNAFLYVNGTTSGYYTQNMYANGSSVASYRDTSSQIMMMSGTDRSIAMAKIYLTDSGYAQIQCNTNDRYFVPSAMNLYNRYTTSTFTMASITSLTITTGLTPYIGAGSRFWLYKCTAEKVADVTISTATTSVDFTGLNITKDSEYMLVSDINNTSASASTFNLYANSNTTATNYYQQYVSANSTSVTANRANTPEFSQANNAQKSLSIATIKLTNNGYFTFQSNNTLLYSSTVPILYNQYGTSTFTATSITQLTVTASVTNAIGIGSRFQLYRLK